MTDGELQDEFEAIWAHEISRTTEQRQVITSLARRLGVTSDMAAAITAELDTSKPGALTVISALISDAALMALWRASQKRHLDQRQHGSGQGSAADGGTS